jgi:O-antigen/teichoic acid export membrane protein
MRSVKHVWKVIALRFGPCLPKGRLFRSAALLSGSTFLVQAAGVCLAPVYARLYAPSDYGIFGQFYCIVATLLTVGCFCYELAIPIAKEEEEALALVVLSVGCLGVITAVSSGWAVLSVWGLNRGPSSGRNFYLLLVPLAVLPAGLYRIAQYWAIRVQAFKAIAGTAVKQMIGGQAVNLGLGLLHPSALGFIFGKIVSSSVGVSSLSQTTSLTSLLKTHRKSVFRMRRLWRVARKHSQYPLTMSPSTLLNALGLFLPGMLMLPYYGAEFAGQFALAQQIGLFPTVLVGSSVSQVFFGEAASVARSDPKKLRPLFNSISHKLALSSLVVMLLCLLAPLVVPIVFGRRWHGAGELTAWLGFGLALQFWVSPLSNMPNVVGRLKGQLIIDSVRAALVFAALYVPYRFVLGGRIAVICYSAVLVANYIACYWLYRHQVVVHSEEIVQKAGLERGVLAAAAPLSEP